MRARRTEASSLRANLAMLSSGKPMRFALRRSSGVSGPSASSRSIRTMERTLCTKKASHLVRSAILSTGMPRRSASATA